MAQAHPFGTHAVFIVEICRYMREIRSIESEDRGESKLDRRMYILERV